MKKLLVLALSALLVLGLATVSMAAATFSGEIRVGVTGNNANVYTSPNLTSDAASNAYAYGKMILSGKLGDDLTGTLVYLADPVSGGIKVDESDVTFTEDWGTVKLGYYGWNNNIKDIIGTITSDVKSQTNISFSFPISDSLKLGLAYAYTGTNNQAVDNWYAEKNAFGADLGWAGDTMGADLMYYNYSTDNNAWGVNAYIKLGEVKPFVQYRALNWGDSYKTSVTDCILGLTWDPTATPIYARVEANIAPDGIYNDVKLATYAKTRYDSAPWGVRLGYKLEDGAVVEFQYQAKGFLNKDNVTANDYYVKLKCPF